LESPEQGIKHPCGIKYEKFLDYIFQKHSAPWGDYINSYLIDPNMLKYDAN